MGLSAVKIPSKTYEFAGEVVAIRGLSLPALMRIFANAGGEMREFFALAQAGKVTPEDSLMAVTKIVAEFPKLAAHAIANAADEPDAWEIAAELPAAVQIEMLDDIAQMTFAVQGGVKKTLETVGRALASLGLSGSNPASTNASGDSVVR